MLFILLLWGVVGSVFSFFRASLFTIAGERLVARIRKQVRRSTSLSPCLSLRLSLSFPRSPRIATTAIYHLLSRPPSLPFSSPTQPSLKVFSSIIQQEIGFFDANRTGELLNRLSSDPTAIRAAVTTDLSLVLRTSGQMIGGLIILFVISWKLTLLMLSVVPLITLFGVWYGKYVKRLSKLVQVGDGLEKEKREKRGREGGGRRGKERDIGCVALGEEEEKGGDEEGSDLDRRRRGEYTRNENQKRSERRRKER